ncbi:MAG: hypothetical protein M1834_008824 [Cirrosporium novae-zelandiae]|nr:MAG: hypothetical protein M1834_008824 [Cirrosporium novae-zelandiae]
MGAGQSTSGAGASPGSIRERKTCYYELLGVEKTATDDEIKKAYRRKALELHPDRNYGDTENATTLFAEIQAAYEVLSDSQERAWYDSHRDAVLRGESDGGAEEHFEHDVRITTTDDILALFTKFDRRVEFSDKPTGFFGALRQMFEILNKEEEIACGWEGLDVLEYPSFGYVDDPYDTVVKPFYTAWSGFATKKTFSWKDVYRYSEAPDRRVRRAMEKENKRLRDEGIKEFNDAVRSLVAFVKKRDPRYKANIQTEAERQKVLRDLAAAQAARSRAANIAKYESEVLPEWSQRRDYSDGEETEEEDEEIEVESFECMLCHKTFKSEKQYEAHEKSKKHLKAIQQIKKQMRKDHKDLNLDDEIMGGNFTGVASPARQDDNVNIVVENFEKVVPGSDNAEVLKETADIPTANDELKNHIDPPQVNDNIDSLKQNPTSSTHSEEDSDYAPRSAIQNRIYELEDPALESSMSDLNVSSTSTPPQKKIGKAKEKRLKRAAKQAEEAASQQGKGFTCFGCNEKFASKTKLFNHIKDSRHTAPQATVGKANNTKEKKKRR